MKPRLQKEVNCHGSVVKLTHEIVLWRLLASGLSHLVVTEIFVGSNPTSRPKLQNAHGTKIKAVHRPCPPVEVRRAGSTIRPTNFCPSGQIGKGAALRTLRFCGFESHLGHQIAKPVREDAPKSLCSSHCVEFVTKILYDYFMTQNKKDWRRQWRKKNKTKVRKWNSSYQKKNQNKAREQAIMRRKCFPFRYVCIGIRAKAKVNNISFNLTESYLEQIWTGVCPVFGEKIEICMGKGRQYRYSKLQKNIASLDRIDPAKGYVIDNVQWLSMQANAMKNNATIKQLQQFAEWIKSSYPC